MGTGKSIEWDRIPTDPLSKLRGRAFFDTEVFSGSVKRGSCGSDFLESLQPFLLNRYVSSLQGKFLPLKPVTAVKWYTMFFMLRG